MTAKEFLSQYRILNDEINAKLEEVAQIRALAERVTPSDRSGGNGNVSDRVGCGAARLADLEREIDQEIDRLVELRREINAVIIRVSNVKCQLALIYRYINGLTHEKTAEKIGISYYHEYRLHKKALEEVKKILLLE